MEQRIEPARALAGELTVPGDKSISHRAAILGALAEGTTEIAGFLEGADPRSTLDCLAALGVEWRRPRPGCIVVHGRGGTLVEPLRVLDAGNSGTTARLLLGVLAAQPFHAVLSGDASLCRRPMGRVVEPLRRMGARIDGREEGRALPLAVRGGGLEAVEHRLAVASAQVKSALLLAGLAAAGTTRVAEPHASRDHTERMLRSFGAQVEEASGPEGHRVQVRGPAVLRGRRVVVPGDISSAAFFLAAAAALPGSRLTVRRVGLNPTRTGVLEALSRMGARIAVERRPDIAGEEWGDVTVEGGPLEGVELGGELIPRLIDELPVLCVLACVAAGETRIRDAAELRVKESDRIATMAGELGRLGARVEALPDGLVVQGGGALRGATVDAHGDHRVAMALAVAGLLAAGDTRIRGAECVDISYPDFWRQLDGLRR